MKIKEITDFLESIIPISSSESYDNCGLLIGDPENSVESALTCLDCTDEVVEEAISLNCKLIIAHHPLIFTGLKSLTGKNEIERIILKCIKNDISLYAIHTNLDNYWKGVNYEIGKRLGLENLKILSPKKDVLNKLVVLVPETHHESLSSAIFEAGAGKIGNYESCHFSHPGIGTFKPIDGASPFSGQIGELSKEEEIRCEFLVSSHILHKVVSEMKRSHPYEEVAYDIIPLLNVNQTEGSGMIGELKEEMDELEFLKMLKKNFDCGTIRHTKLLNRKIKTVAFCGGAGSFLLNKAIQNRADIYITGDFKYHEFFNAESKIIIADIGHYESEQFTSNLLADILKEKFTTFAVHLTEVNTNPIKYF